MKNWPKNLSLLDRSSASDVWGTYRIEIDKEMSLKIRGVGYF